MPRLYQKNSVRMSVILAAFFLMFSWHQLLGGAGGRAGSYIWSLEYLEWAKPGKAGGKGLKLGGGEEYCLEKGIWLLRKGRRQWREALEGRQPVPMTSLACLNILPGANLKKRCKKWSFMLAILSPYSRDPELRAILLLREIEVREASIGWLANQTPIYDVVTMGKHVLISKNELKTSGTQSIHKLEAA